MYDRILVPTDGSPGVERAVDHAIGLAEVHGATIHAVYVVNAATFATLPMETSWEGVGAMLREDGQVALERVEELAAEREVPVETHVVEGSPSREIVRFAEESDVDAIVMGTHGRGGIDRLLLGSVAERVVRSSTVPVTTVRVGEVEADEPPAEEAATDADAVDGAEAAEDAQNHV